MKEFSENVKALRESKGLTQEQLGKIVGVKKGAVSIWELGTGFPKVPTLLLLADFFNVPISFLFNETNVEDIKTLSVDGLSQEQQNYLTEIIEALRIKNDGKK